MFICGVCKELSKPREKAFPVVLERRKAVYQARVYLSKARGQEDGGKVKKIHDPGGEGWEIVKEIRAHRECAGPHNKDILEAAYTLSGAFL